jgi:hypothetical protein
MATTIQLQSPLKDAQLTSYFEIRDCLPRSPLVVTSLMPVPVTVSWHIRALVNTFLPPTFSHH